MADAHNTKGIRLQRTVDYREYGSENVLRYRRGIAPGAFTTVIEWSRQ